MSDYKITIGLEVHVALKTKSKLFSRSACDFESDKFSYFDAGIPGMLPVLSAEPVKMALKFAAAVNAEIPDVSFFERKHYFYPDLALGYQLTQQHKPIMIGGFVPLEIDGKIIEVEIEHSHLECDAAKSLHDKFTDQTAIDLSRGSSPLLEIVTTPCIHSVKAAKLYAQTVCEIVKYLDICDGKLEEGSFRVDASISLSKTDQLGTRVEVKNISSFGFLEDALNYEIERQTEMLDSGIPIVMETRLFNESTSSTHSMRKKETVHEYRYMQDPDILPLVLDQDLKKEILNDDFMYYFKIRDKLKSIFSELSITADVTQFLTSRYKDIWKMVISDSQYQNEYFIKMLAYWISESHPKSDINGLISKDSILEFYKHKLDAKAFKEAMSKHMLTGLPVDKCVPEKMDLETLKSIIDECKIEHEMLVLECVSADSKMTGFILGKLMSKVKGRVAASVVRAEFLKSIGV